MANDSIAAMPTAVDSTRSTRQETAVARPGSDVLSDIWLLALGTLGLLIPFLAKPVNMDDPLFVWTAQQVLRQPGDFYGFDVNWYGFVQPMHDVNKNPPGAAYLLAGALLVGGDRELVMHAVYLVPNIALVLGTYLLARRFCHHPVLAAVAACATPVVLVSATTLMCDNLMAALWCWSMLAWLWGLDRGSVLGFVLAGLLAAAAALCKYFGICVVPLMVAYSLIRVRRLGWWLVAAVIPLATLALFEWYCYQRYGHGLLRGAVDYVGAKQSREAVPGRLFQALVFLGGCLITVGCAAPWCWSPRVTLPVVFVAALVFAAWTAAAVFPDPELRDEAALRWVLPLHATLFLLAAAQVIGLAASDLARCWRNPTGPAMADSVLLNLWLVGTLLFAALGNWTITARTFVPMTAPAGILLVRRLESYRQLKLTVAPRGLWFAVGIGAAVALSAARADYTFAKSAREAGAALVHNFAQPGHILWFQGHWGFQYYIMDSGAQALDVTRDTLLAGDILIVPLENSNLIVPPTEVAELLGDTSWGFRRTPWIATQSTPWRGKFYATLGRLALPYVCGAINADNYLVFRMKQPYRFTF